MDEVEKIMSMTDAEILEWAKSEGMDPEQVAKAGRAALDKAVAMTTAEQLEALAYRRGLADAFDEAAKALTEAEQRVLAKQYSDPNSFQETVNFNLRMTVVMLPDLANGFRARATAIRGM